MNLSEVPVSYPPKRSKASKSPSVRSMDRSDYRAESPSPISRMRADEIKSCNLRDGSITEKCDDVFKSTILYSLIKMKKWDLAIERCNGPDKKEAGFWVLQNVDFEWKSLPLHMACELQAPYEVIKALLDAFEPAARMKDSLCRYPLHIACLCRASYNAIALLLDCYPEATKIPDDAGCIPLHYASRKGTNEKTIDQLLIYNHRGAQVLDSYGLLPIHWACKHNAPVGIVESLLRAHPHSVQSVDQYGRTPKDLVSASVGTEKAQIVRALDQDPSYWTTSLLNEVDMLKDEIKNLEQEKDIISNSRGEDVERLEKLLSQVTEASSEAAKNFRHLKSELEYENSSLKVQVKNLTQEIFLHEETIETQKEENDRLAKELKYLEDDVKFENASMKVEIKKLKADNVDYKKEISELYNDNVRLTQEVNRLTEQIDYFSKFFNEFENHRSHLNKITNKMEESLTFRKGH